MPLASSTGPLTITKPEAGDNVKTHETGTGATGYNHANLDNVNAAFNATTGHDHDGTDSKKVLATNLNVTGLTVSKFTRVNAGGTAMETAEIPADSAAASHIAASAEVHGLPASVNVLGNRSAAGEFVQRGQASNADTVGSDTPYYLGNGFAVTFAVAFTGTPKVFVSYNGSIAGGNAIIASLSGAPSTTGFTYLISGSKNGTFTPPVDWVAFGA